MTTDPTTLGFLGTGHISSCVITGLMTAEVPPDQVVVSPRNAEIAADLAARFARVTIATDNQDVVDRSEAVFLALRPQSAGEVIAPLTFRADQLVISLMALTPLAEVRAWVDPATAVVRALPLPPIARGAGPTVLTPDEPRARQLFDRVGTAVPTASEADFDRIGSLTALAAPFYQLLETSTRWTAAQGVSRATAGRYMAALFHGLAADGLDPAEGDFSDLVAGLATPETINLQALTAIREAGGFAAFEDGLTQVLARIESREN